MTSSLVELLRLRAAKHPLGNQAAPLVEQKIRDMFGGVLDTFGDVHLVWHGEERLPGEGNPLMHAVVVSVETGILYIRFWVTFGPASFFHEWITLSPALDGPRKADIAYSQWKMCLSMWEVWRSNIYRDVVDAPGISRIPISESPSIASMPPALTAPDVEGLSKLADLVAALDDSLDSLKFGGVPDCLPPEPKPVPGSSQNHPPTIGGSPGRKPPPNRRVII